MTGVYVSALDLFSIGIGPSSSHTVGPMRAAHLFAAQCARAIGHDAHLDEWSVTCDLEGSLGATGLGHGTPDAVIAGLNGDDPETCDPADVRGTFELLRDHGELVLNRGPLRGVTLHATDVRLCPGRRRPEHPNSMVLTLSNRGEIVRSAVFLSVGGGFVRELAEQPADQPASATSRTPVSTYRTAAELLQAVGDGTIADLARADEVHWHGEARLDAGLQAIWQTMRECIELGLTTRGTLPGFLRVPRRAADMHEQILSRGGAADAELLATYAMAVNEQNAAGERIVTAPTNGAAGVLPAILYDHLRTSTSPEEDVPVFLLTAAVVGSLIKANASISGAEAGCQGEVGSACAMAAAGLCAVRGGTPLQIENAAEIAMEHHLGLTCDPVGGLVQIPCIERNAVAANTARAACQLALLGSGHHIVSLDTVIETMRQTGADMSTRYKETSEAGLAVNVVEC